MEPKSHLINNIQALRAVAAFLVIFVHLEDILKIMGLPKFGYGGVDIFFVISGFIMIAVAVRNKPGPVSFMLERFARIAPLYWVATVLVFGLALAAPFLFKGTQATLDHLLKSLFFIPYARENGTVFPLVFVGWTLNYEMFFYALFALGLFVPRRAVGYALVIATLIGLVAAGVLLKPQAPVLKFYASPIILEFGFGMALALAYPRMPALGRPAAFGVMAGVVVALIVLVAGDLWRAGVSTAITRGAPAVLIVAGALLLERSGWAIRAPWVIALGNASYATYLFHPFVTQVVSKIVVASRQPWLAGPGVLAALAGALLVGLLLHRLVELPLTRWVKGLLFGKRPVARPVVAS